MMDFFTFIGNFWRSLIALFDAHPLQIGNYSVSFFALIFAFLIISLVAAVFWKGARA